ncbi:MAG: 2-succinyl-5-enolpyruvyl-6-hydroxy-3-cyclohexene-1-carboxylic-acid synthase [Nocardioidaceae bacterium]
MNDSTRLASAVISALLRAGVADVVLAPGSRSAPLAIGLQAADRARLLRLHVRVDERTAGFLALGLAKGGHRPVAVVTTSGTAVANLHPAVLEARHVGERLLVLSADRPSELRGTGANQTTDQVGMFGAAVPCVDVPPGLSEVAAGAVTDAVRRVGPTQINLQFADPLLPDQASSSTAFAAPADPDDGVSRPQLAEPDGSVRLGFGPRTVVVAGDDAGPPARLLAQRANWPLLAEPTSGSRTGTHALRTYRLLLATELGDRIERVVVVGHPTLTRPVTRLISRRDIEVISVRGVAGVCTDPGRLARHVDAVPVVEGSDDNAWLAAWRQADARLAALVDEWVAADPAALPLRVAGEVAAAVTPEALLVVGSSQPIRDLDIMAAPYPAGQRRLVIGNRGLSGIDGTLSTAIGAALARRSSRSLAYVGDLTFLHDANALVFGPDEPRPDLTIVVANDDGGAIFSTLEQGASSFAAGFERVFGTPHGVRLRALCEASHTAYERVDTADALRAALAVDARGIRLLEVPLSRSGRRVLAERLHDLGRSVSA